MRFECNSQTQNGSFYFLGDRLRQNALPPFGPALRDLDSGNAVKPQQSFPMNLKCLFCD